MCKFKGVKVSLFVPAAAASTAPPFGPILGQYGVNTVQFCKEFNEATEGLSLFFQGLSIDTITTEFILVVDMHINDDRSFKFVINKPTTSFLLSLMAGVKVGAPQSVSGVIFKKEVLFLAYFKYPDSILESSCSMMTGTARSIGIRII